VEAVSRELARKGHSRPEAAPCPALSLKLEMPVVTEPIDCRQ